MKFHEYRNQTRFERMTAPNKDKEFAKAIKQGEIKASARRNSMTKALQTMKK